MLPQIENKEQLSAYIKYAISQLNTHNGSADFEKMCLHYSRARIHPNILPATGPVQAGGDQGRDFETFISYLSQTPIADKTFLAKNAGSYIAFACSLQKDPAKKNGKIDTDVKSISGSGSPVERIYFFSGVDIPVAKRHKCQGRLKEDFGIEVEIIDANALSLYLADEDLFWIAVQYLRIPPDIYPKAKQDGDWYAALFADYKAHKGPCQTYEEYAEIRAALAYNHNRGLKADIVFWIGKLNEIINNKRLPIALIRRAIYTRFVSSWDSFHTITDLEDSVVEYFSDFESDQSVGELEDACDLYVCAIESKALLRGGFADNFLISIAERLENELTKRINTAEQIHTKCALMEIFVRFSFYDVRTDPPAMHANYVKRLNDLIKELPRANFYPVERLLDYILAVMKQVRNTPFFKELDMAAVKVEDVISKRGQRDLLADKLSKRISMYMDQEEIGKAISTLHQLKMLLFREDSMPACIDTCFSISEKYHRIKLHFAAKYYALIGACLAVASDKEYLYKEFIKGMGYVALNDYKSGSLINYLIREKFRLQNVRNFKKNYDPAEDVANMYKYLTSVRFITAAFLPSLNESVDGIMKFFPFEEKMLETRVTSLKEMFHNKSQEEILENIDCQMNGRVFNDVGKVRLVEFNALGINWCFEFDNTYEVNAVAEQFIVIVQVLIAELMDEELYLVPVNTRIRINIVEGGEGIKMDELPGDNAYLLEIGAAECISQPEQKWLHILNYYIKMAEVIIGRISLLPAEEKAGIFSKYTDAESTNKFSFGRPYAELYMRYPFEDDPKRIELSFFDNPLNTRKYVPWVNSALPGKSGMAPAYNQDKSLQLVREKLDVSLKAISVTLPLLQQKEFFREIVKRLRQDKWLDWQILAGTVNIVVDYKTQRLSSDKKGQEWLDIYNENIKRDEADWYMQIPDFCFTEDNIRACCECLCIDVLENLGLQWPRPSYSKGHIQALREFLSGRFNFSTDGMDLPVFGEGFA